MDLYGLSWNTSYRRADLLREAAQARLVKEARGRSEAAEAADRAAVHEDTSEAA